MHLELVSRQAPKEACVREDVRVSLDLAAVVVVPKASDVLAARLREMILSSGLAEGTPLPTERELVAQSGLSRASVREALRVLETEGLVLTARRPQWRLAGAAARPGIDLALVRAVRAQPRRAFRGLARSARGDRAGRRGACGDPPAGRRSRRDDAHPQRARSRVDDVAEHVRLNLLWHRAIMRASRNELLIAFFDAIADSVQAATESRSLNSADVRREVVRAHGRVLAAIAAKDADAAFRRMQRHVGAYSSLVKTLAEDEGKKARNGRKPARRKR